MSDPESTMDMPHHDELRAGDLLNTVPVDRLDRAVTRSR